MDFITNLKNVYKKPRVLVMFILGFSAGIPILLVFSTLSTWLREAGVSRSEIGFASWVGMAYAIKFLWSPLVDRLPIPILTKILGRRRSWMILAQFGIIAGITGMAYSNPAVNLAYCISFALLLAFSSATQDIVIDAFRIDTGADDEQAAMVSLYVYGYRIAMLIAGAGALTMADIWGSSKASYIFSAWSNAYLIMALCMVPCVFTVLFLKEPNIIIKPAQNVAQWMTDAIVIPFKEILTRYGTGIVFVLLSVTTYRISDVVMGVMANPFYIDVGFTKTEIAGVIKVFGFWMTMAGLGLGGVIMAAIGQYRTMILAAILAAATNILFAVLSVIGNSVPFLTLTISLDNLASGIATTAFLAYLSSLANKQFTATQYAMLSSIMVLLPKFLAGFSGVIVDAIGYGVFFTSTAVIGIPVIYFVIKANTVIEKQKQSVK